MNFKVIYGFVPWIVFSVLANESHPRSVVLAAIASLLVAAALLAQTLRQRQTPKILDSTGLAVFAVITVVGFFGSDGTDRFLATYGQAIASATLTVVIFALLPKLAFTEQYARESVPEQYWYSPVFRSINRRITLVWGAAIALMSVCGLVATITGMTGVASIALQWGVPVVLVCAAISYTKRTSEAASAAQDLS